MKLFFALAMMLACAGQPFAVSAIQSTDVVIPVAIYRGPASCEDCSEAIARAIVRSNPHYRVVFVGPHERDDVSLSTLKRFRIYVQPGGGQGIDAALTALGDRRISAIRSFVANGGNYLGLCMGAYLADHSDIGLIPDDLASEVGRPGSSARTENDTVVHVAWGNRHERLYYQDGPFLPDHPNALGFQRIAAYGNGDLAAARYDVGKGIVVLSGPHPEADSSWYEDANLPTDLVPHSSPIKLLLDALPAKVR